MFKCYSCGCTFEYFGTIKDYVGEYWGRPAYQNIAVCPYCKSENFDEYHYEDEYEDDEEEDDE